MSIAAAKLKKKGVVDVYTQTAPIYDLWGSLTETKARQRSLTVAQIHDGMSILEVAIGTGLTFQEILRTNPNGQNVSVDLTPAMLRHYLLTRKRFDPSRQVQPHVLPGTEVGEGFQTFTE